MIPVITFLAVNFAVLVATNKSVLALVLTSEREMRNFWKKQPVTRNRAAKSVAAKISRRVQVPSFLFCNFVLTAVWLYYFIATRR